MKPAFRPCHFLAFFYHFIVSAALLWLIVAIFLLFVGNFLPPDPEKLGFALKVILPIFATAVSLIACFFYEKTVYHYTKWMSSGKWRSYLRRETYTGWWARR